MTAVRLGKRKWATIVLVGLVGQFAWTIENMYFNVYLYNTISTDPDYIAAMVGWSAAAATLTALLMGALSDRVGKRRIFIAGGYILWGRLDGGLRACHCRERGKAVPGGQRRLGGGRHDSRARLCHDLLRLHGERRRLQRLAHGRDGRVEQGQGRVSYRHPAAHLHARHLWGLRRPHTAGAVERIFPHLRRAGSPPQASYPSFW